MPNKLRNMDLSVTDVKQPNPDPANFIQNQSCSASSFEPAVPENPRHLKARKVTAAATLDMQICQRAKVKAATVYMWYS